MAEVFEETGYSIGLDDLIKIRSFKSGVGTAATTQTLYYAEVSQQCQQWLCFVAFYLLLLFGKKMELELTKKLVFFSRVNDFLTYGQFIAGEFIGHGCRIVSIFSYLFIIISFVSFK